MKANRAGGNEGSGAAAAQAGGHVSDANGQPGLRVVVSAYGMALNADRCLQILDECGFVPNGGTYHRGESAQYPGRSECQGDGEVLATAWRRDVRRAERLMHAKLKTHRSGWRK